LIAERSYFGLQRPFADQGQASAELARQAAECVDHDVGLLLAIEAADVDQQRLAVAQAEPGAQFLVAAGRTELADFDAERHDLDRIDAEAPELGRAAVLAQRE